MTGPALVEWRGLPRLAALDALARRESARLGTWSSNLHVRKVRIEARDRSLFPQGGVCVGIEARGPERQVIVNRAHEDAGMALRDAFGAVFRSFDRRMNRDRRAFPGRVREARAA